MLNRLFGRASAVQIKSITPQDLRRRLKQHNHGLCVVDVRTAAEYGRDGHIHGARHLPLGSLPGRFGELPQGDTIVCVCRSGARSYVACEQLQQAGYDVVNMSGGMLNWRRSSLPVQHG